VLATSTESMLAGDFVRTEEARYAAEAALERAMADVALAGDWTALVASTLSTFSDGPPNGTRVLADGRALDLASVVAQANCAKAACSAADVAANANGQRPWGVNNPVWRLFAYGPFASLMPDASIRSGVYLVVMVAGDPSATGAVALRAEAFGPRGVHQVVSAIVERPDGAGAAVRTRTQLMTNVR